MIAENPFVVEPHSMDNLLAQEFLSLSFQDRNAINEEMHGVSCLLPEETPELIQILLEKLVRELGTIPSHEKRMYELCQSRYGRKKSNEEGGSYVNDVDFRVRFLRCELFDAAKAARKLACFLDVVVDLFGEYALQRPIRLSDFTEDELQAFRTGNLQLLPFRDRSGRRIVVAVEGCAIQIESALRMKILYYLLWVAGEDLETQLKGIVVIIWPVADIAMEHLKHKERIIETQRKQLNGSTVRVCAFHFCVHDTPFFHLLKMIFAMSLDSERRSRLKFHVGRVIELQYLIKCYGIPVDHIPLTGTGNVKTQNLRLWLKLRNAIENPKEGSPKNIIECPGSNDVLFRPSKLIKGHPGNVKFHSLIEHYHEKGLGITAASKEIISDIYEDNGRILGWEKRGWWAEMTDQVQIQFKISVSYRDYKKKQKGKLQFYDSSTCAFQEQDGKRQKRRELADSILSSTVQKKQKNLCSPLIGDGGGMPLIRW